jgi:hypothetical protein
VLRRPYRRSTGLRIARLRQRQYLRPRQLKQLRDWSWLERGSRRRYRPEQTGTTRAQGAGMLMRALARWRRVVARSRTELGSTIRTVQHGGPQNRLQGHNVGRDDGEKPPQKLA